MRFISKGQPTPLARIEEEYLPRMLGYYRHSPPQGFWAAHLRDTEEFIGWFHLRPDKIEPQAMELGYRLKRKFWGRGLATEGSRALLGNAFGEWRYEMVCARTLAVNLASRRVMEKIGLRHDEIQRIGIARHQVVGIDDRQRIRRHAAREALAVLGEKARIDRQMPHARFPQISLPTRASSSAQARGP